MTFSELPIKSYFYFQKGKIRKKVSKRKYIWIKDEDELIIYCLKLEDETSQEKWPVNNQTSIVTKIDFKY